MYLLMEWEGYTGKYLVQGNNIWTEHSKVCVLWTRNKNFSLFFLFSQGRTRNSKFIEKCDFFTHFLFFFMFLQQICVSAGPDGFFWIGSCQLVQPYMSVFSMVFWMGHISLENLVLDQLKKSPNWYFLHSHHFSAWYCTDLM